MDLRRNQISISQFDEKLDEQFVQLLKKIEEKYLIFNKHLQIRIQKWVEKLLEYDENTVWRKCRNNYINLLYVMVMREKIQGVFLRMPPEKDLPNLTDSEYKMANYEYKQLCKIQDRKNSQFVMRKVDSPEGDIGSQIATPNCQTDRLLQNQKSVSFFNKQQSNPKPSSNCLPTKNTKTEQKLLQKLSTLLSHYRDQFRNNKEYNQILSMLNLNLNLNSSNQKKMQTFDQGITQKSQSAELRVQEGIEVNKANLFQFGSPRGMTQMQYFRAALQL